MSAYLKYCLLSALFFLPPGAASADMYSALHVRSAIVVDSGHSVLFALNPDAKLPPASTAKLVTAMVVLENLPPEQSVVVSANAAATHTVSPRLRRGEVFSVEDLLHLALMRSVNSAAVALSEAVAGSEERFSKLMNAKARSIGAHDTLFENSSGLPGSYQHTTVYDLTLILRESLKYPLIRDILGKKEVVVKPRSGRVLKVENTDKLLWVMGNMIGGKTGYTNSAKHCFVGAAETENGVVYAAVLGASSRSALWHGTGSLLGMDPESEALKGIFEGKPKAAAVNKKKKPVRAKKAAKTVSTKSRSKKTKKLNI